MRLTEIKHNKVMLFNHYLGIDISKNTLDAALIVREGVILGQLKVANDKQGFKEILSWMKKLEVNQNEVLVCAEHTGIYGYDLQVWLDDKQIQFAFVPALEIKKSLGIRRGKNDAVDAVRIAEYAYLRRESITLSHKPSDTIFQLKTLLTERKQYVRTRAGLLARKDALEKYESKESSKRRENLVKQFSKYIESLEEQIVNVIEQSPEIKANYKLVRSVKGIGLINAVNTIVYTNNFTSFQTARQYACYIGIAPFEHTSGTSIKGRTMVSQLGNHQLKCELTMAARNAISTDPWLKSYYKRKMAEKGNVAGVHGIVLNAVKFKLVVRMFAVVKSGSPYKVLSYY